MSNESVKVVGFTATGVVATAVLAYFATFGLGIFFAAFFFVALGIGSVYPIITHLSGGQVHTDSQRGVEALIESQRGMPEVYISGSAAQQIRNQTNYLKSHNEHK